VTAGSSSASPEELPTRLGTWALADTAPPPGNPFPAGTAVSHLDVYNWMGPDGRRGGSAHVHLTCTEGYVVIGGHGQVQTLGPQGYAEEELVKGKVVWFSPGIIHRLVNDTDLEIVVVMQNGGLPEAGDCVLSFPPETLADADLYQTAASLADPDAVYATGEEGARHRKNLAVQGFLALRERFAAEGQAALEPFYDAAAELVSSRLPGWRELWQSGPLAAAVRTGEQLEALERGDHRYLYGAELRAADRPAERSYGMCGRLETYPDLRGK
jgi:mannose-6-phosphate isomerase-like protein (cupin superfamily)